MRKLVAIALVAVGVTVIVPATAAQAKPAVPKCGVHPTDYLGAGGALPLKAPKSYSAHIRDVKGLDLTLEVTLRGGYEKEAGEIAAMHVKTTIRTTDPEDTTYLDTSYYGSWEVDTKRTGTGLLWFPDADGEWVEAQPACNDANTFVTSFTGRVTVRDVNGAIDTVGFHAVQTLKPALPW